MVAAIGLQRAGPRGKNAFPWSGLTLYDKGLGLSTLSKTYDDGDALIYIDRQLVQEVSSPQAFARLDYREPNGATPRRTISRSPTTRFRRDSGTNHKRMVLPLGKSRV